MNRITREPTRIQRQLALVLDEDLANPDLALANQTISRLKRERAILVDHIAMLKGKLDELIPVEQGAPGE
jgi:hypothetical protein